MRTAFFALFLMLLLGGCAGSGNYYILSNPSQPVHVRQTHTSIGVETVTVPKYLFKRDLAVAKSANHIVFLSGAQWAEDMDEGLTRRVVTYLQHALHNPDVHAYPWGVEQQPKRILNIAISRFIAQNGKVYLDASWSLEDTQSGRSTSHLFSTSVETGGSDAEHIVAAMDRAFGRFEAALARGLK